MSNEPKDPNAKDRAPPRDDAPTPPQGNEAKRSGRVAFDARGNSVWEWQLETGVYSRDVNTQKLKKLDLGDLSIAETATHKRPARLEEPRPGDGFNPYDNARTTAKKLTPAPSAPEPKARAPRGPDELRKLSEWIKLKKRLGDDKKK